jgi:hypothetical protein
VSWPLHFPAAGPIAKAPTMTLSFVPASGTRRPGRAGRAPAEKVPPSLVRMAVTTWSPQAVPTDATCGSSNTAAATR